MPDLDTTIADGDPGHALLHQDANTEINSLRARMAAVETKNTQQDSSISQKYTLPAGHLPLTPTQQTLLAAAVIATNSTTRPSGAGTTLFTGADPGTNATPGVDVWIGELAP